MTAKTKEPAKPVIGGSYHPMVLEAQIAVPRIELDVDRHCPWSRAALFFWERKNTATLKLDEVEKKIVELKKAATAAAEIATENSRLRNELIVLQKQRSTSDRSYHELRDAADELRRQLARANAELVLHKSAYESTSGDLSALRISHATLTDKHLKITQQIGIVSEMAALHLRKNALTRIEVEILSSLSQ